MKFIDSFDQIIDLKNQYNDKLEFLPVWKNYCNHVNPDLYQLCFDDIKNYDFQKQVLPIIVDALYANFSLLQCAHDNYIKMQQELVDWSKEFFGDIDIDVYFIVGLCNGAGWVTLVSGRPSIVLGVEKFVELRWHQYESMKSIISHEIGHAVHFNYRNNWEEEYSDMKLKSCFQLYSEGFAQYCQTMAVNNEVARGRDWEIWCQTNEEIIKAEYLHRLDNAISTQDFFGDWCKVFDHSDLGYYLGLQFIRYLLKSKSLQEVAIIPIGEVEKELRQFLSNK